MHPQYSIQQSRVEVYYFLLDNTLRHCRTHSFVLGRCLRDTGNLADIAHCTYYYLSLIYLQRYPLDKEVSCHLRNTILAHMT